MFQLGSRPLFHFVEILHIKVLASVFGLIINDKLETIFDALVISKTLSMKKNISEKNAFSHSIPKAVLQSGAIGAFIVERYRAYLKS